MPVTFFWKYDIFGLGKPKLNLFHLPRNGILGRLGGALIRYKCSSVVVPSILWCINCWCINFWYILLHCCFCWVYPFFWCLQSSLLPHRPSIFEQEDEDELRYDLLRSSRGSSELYEHVRPLEPWGGCFLAAGGLSAISHATKPGRYRDLYFKWWLRRWGFTNGGGEGLNG